MQLHLAPVVVLFVGLSVGNSTETRKWEAAIYRAVPLLVISGYLNYGLTE